MDRKGTRVEFYRYGSDKYMAVVSGVGAVPQAEDLINIRGVTFQVTAVTWAVDHADDISRAELRANVVLERVVMRKKRQEHDKSVGVCPHGVSYRYACEDCGL